MENFFSGLLTAIVDVWRGRSAVGRTGMFDDPAAATRSRRWLTVVAVVVTFLALVAGVAMAWWLWRMFTTTPPGRA